MIEVVHIEIHHKEMNKGPEIKTLRGDELTSAISEAIIYLQELQQKEMVV